MCAKSKAVQAETDVRANYTGKSIDELKELNLSGTHVERHMVDVLANCRWPGGQADVLGDWAQTAGAPASRPARKSSRSVYQPNASMKEQVEARLRFARMLQTAFAYYQDNVGPVTWETTWDDLLPLEPPECLVKYYGTQSASEAPMITAEMITPKIPFKKPVPLKRSKSAVYRIPKKQA